MAKHINLGIKGEELAIAFLKKKQYKILEINWRYSRAEIDIIAKDGDVLVFIEVKTRSTNLWGDPSLAVTPKKEKLLTAAASVYMENIGHEWEIRFDIISIIINGQQKEIKHFEDAFFPGLG